MLETNERPLPTIVIGQFDPDRPFGVRVRPDPHTSNALILPCFDDMDYAERFLSDFKKATVLTGIWGLIGLPVVSWARLLRTVAAQHVTQIEFLFESDHKPASTLATTDQFATMTEEQTRTWLKHLAELGRDESVTGMAT